jgi:hypothetical protein
VGAENYVTSRAARVALFSRGMFARPYFGTGFAGFSNGVWGGQLLNEGELRRQGRNRAAENQLNPPLPGVALT